MIGAGWLHAGRRWFLIAATPSASKQVVTSVCQKTSQLSESKW